MQLLHSPLLFCCSPVLVSGSTLRVTVVVVVAVFLFPLGPQLAVFSYFLSAVSRSSHPGSVSKATL